MQRVIIRNLSQMQMAPVSAPYCDSFLSQLRGLTFRRYLPPEEGLLLVGQGDSRINASIHMLWVFFDLAIVWINSAGVVVDVCLARKWRPAYVPRYPAQYVLELAAFRLHDFNVGDRVQFENVSESAGH